MHLRPSNSPARAVDTAISGLFLGILWVLLTYSTEVLTPLSISMYPVGITSRPDFLIKRADFTCSPIKSSGFLPEISDKLSNASAFGLNCKLFPGKRITGLELLDFMTSMDSE